MKIAVCALGVVAGATAVTGFAPTYLKRPAGLTPALARQVDHGFSCNLSSGTPLVRTLLSLSPALSHLSPTWTACRTHVWRLFSSVRHRCRWLKMSPRRMLRSEAAGGVCLGVVQRRGGVCSSHRSDRAALRTTRTMRRKLHHLHPRRYDLLMHRDIAYAGAGSAPAGWASCALAKLMVPSAAEGKESDQESSGRGDICAAEGEKSGQERSGGGE